MTSQLAAGAGARRSRRPQTLRLIPAIALLAAGCAGGGAPPPSNSSAEPGTSALVGTITLYTSVTQGTVDAVVAGYRSANAGVRVEVFRAPTGELAARIAADLREGRIRADVLWLTDPLSIQGYAAQNLLRAWQPVEASGIDSAYRSETFWGTRFLNMVMVRGDQVTPGPKRWKDLAEPAYRDAVALPDPGFAGSAFGALGYFAQTDGFGIEFFRSLKANGAVQLKTPDEITTGVAEGRFKAGITIDNSARTAIGKGSPIRLAWPEDGAIAMYSPIGVVAATSSASTAESFVSFVLSEPGQKAIAGTGWQPIRAGSGGPLPEGRQVYPDWAAAFGRQAELLAEYRAIFGG